MGEVMNSCVTFVHNSIRCFYPASVLRVVCLMARIWAKCILEIIHFEG